MTNRYAMRTAIATAAFGAALTCAPMAHADANDDAYIAAWRSHGIGDGQGAAEMIRVGHMICGKLDAGVSSRGIVVQAVIAAGNTPDSYVNRMTLADFAVVIHAAATAYCPWHLGSY